MKSFRCLLVAATLVLTSPVFAQSSSAPGIAAAHPALKDAVILIIRHAEKPETGFELSPEGRKRAEAYAQYFKNFAVDSKPLTPDCLIATADSNGSHRPRLTLEPLSHALGLPIESRVKNKNFHELVEELQSRDHGRHILICWHHGEIPNLAESLGADVGKLLPGGKWPSNEFSWVLLLRFDHEGRLIPNETRCIHEKLMPGDV